MELHTEKSQPMKLMLAILSPPNLFLSTSVQDTGRVCCYCSVIKSCPTLCDSMDCSMPGSSVLRYLLESTQTHVHWVSDAINHWSPPSPPALILSLHQSFPVSQLFASGGQNIGASVTVLPTNIQGWFPLGLTGLISLQSKRQGRQEWNRTC